MLESGLEFFLFWIACCPIQKTQPRKAELAMQIKKYLNFVFSRLTKGH